MSIKILKYTDKENGYDRSGKNWKDENNKIKLQTLLNNISITLFLA